MYSQINIPVMWDIPQAEKESGLTRFTLMQWIKAGRIRYVRLGAGKNGKILINAQSLCEYMGGTTAQQ